MTIQQERVFPVGKERVFEVLVSGQSFAQATAATADFDASEGGAFSCFNDQITGRFLEIIPEERIVQAWRVAGWPPGEFSIVKFSLQPDDGGTRIKLEQSAIPEGSEAHLEAGWDKMYWSPLREFLQ